MTGFNHAAVGGFIAHALPLPLAIPAAIASHFLLDMLPHYGIPQKKRNGWSWRIFTTTDFFFAWIYLGIISLSRHHYAVFFCGVLAASPDFLWVARVLKTKSFDLSKNKSKFTKWHARIQRYERPSGIYFEAPIIAVLIVLVYKFW